MAQTSGAGATGGTGGGAASGSAGAASGTGAGATGTAQSGGEIQNNQNLPPGLQNREQLPPGLDRREQLPPGLQRGGAGSARFDVPGTNAPGGQPGIVPGDTNRVPMTGTAATQRSTATATRIQDKAFTAADQRLLTQVRGQVLPVLNVTEATTPVHFITQNGVVTLVGSVPTAEQRQRIVTLIERTPGVVQVVDQLQVGTDTSTMIGSSGVSGSTLGTGTGSVAGSATSLGTNLTPTSRIGATNRVFSGTNQLTNPQLTPPSDQTLQNRPNQGSLPPGLQNRDQLPPGLQQQEQLPPGLERRDNTGTAGNPSSR